MEVTVTKPVWKPVKREDGLFVVGRDRGEWMRGKFRSEESATKAAARANVAQWLRDAVRAAPEDRNIPGHIRYYARMLADTTGVSIGAATAQCREWAEEEAAWVAMRPATA